MHSASAGCSSFEAAFALLPGFGSSGWSRNSWRRVRATAPSVTARTLSGSSKILPCTSCGPSAPVSSGARTHARQKLASAALALALARSVSLAHGDAARSRVLPRTAALRLGSSHDPQGDGVGEPSRERTASTTK
eukprot:1846975-Rhodomonas_salina.1